MAKTLFTPAKAKLYAILASSPAFALADSHALRIAMGMLYFPTSRATMLAEMGSFAFLHVSDRKSKGGLHFSLQ
jgi:hypothetical protein